MKNETGNFKSPVNSRLISDFAEDESLNRALVLQAVHQLSRRVRFSLLAVGEDLEDWVKDEGQGPWA